MKIIHVLRDAVLLTLTTVFAVPACAEQESALSAHVDAAVRQQMKNQKIPGLSLVVVRNGKVIKAGGYGFANLEVSAPVKVETIFQAGSITKQFTATAVMLLAEQGKLALDESWRMRTLRSRSTFSRVQSGITAIRAIKCSVS